MGNWDAVKGKPNSTNINSFDQQINEFRMGLYNHIGQVYQNQAKDRLKEEKEQKRKTMSMKNPPPMPTPPPPPPQLQNTSSPATDLLSQIHRGVELRKIDREQLKAEQDESMMGAVDTLTDLQSILHKSMQERKFAILGGDDSESWSSDESWSE